MSKANLVGKEDNHIKKKKLICEETVWTYSLRDPHSSTFQGPLCKESRYRQKLLHRADHEKRGGVSNKK